MYLRINGTNQHLTLKERRLSVLRGQGVMHFKLAAEVTGPIPDASESYCLQLAGTVSIEFDRHRYPINALSPSLACVLSPSHAGLHGYLDLTFVISDQALDAIERERQGRPVEMHFDVEGLLLRASGGWFTVHCQDSHRATAEEWAALLAQVQYHTVVRFEIPTRVHQLAGEGTDTWQRAVTRLTQAQGSLWQGDTRLAIAAVRDVIELLWPQHSEFDKSKAQGLDERFELIVSALKHLAHLGHHEDELARQVEWRREDAVAALAILGALLLRRTEGRPGA